MKRRTGDEKNPPSSSSSSSNTLDNWFVKKNTTTTSIPQIQIQPQLQSQLPQLKDDGDKDTEEIEEKEEDKAVKQLPCLVDWKTLAKVNNQFGVQHDNELSVLQIVSADKKEYTFNNEK